MVVAHLHALAPESLVSQRQFWLGRHSHREQDSRPLESVDSLALEAASAAEVTTKHGTLEKQARILASTNEHTYGRDRNYVSSIRTLLYKATVACSVRARVSSSGKAVLSMSNDSGNVETASCSLVTVSDAASPSQIFSEGNGLEGKEHSIMK